MDDTDEMQPSTDQISELMAQLSALQAQMQQLSGTVKSPPSPPALPHAPPSLPPLLPLQPPAPSSPASPYENQMPLLAAGIGLLVLLILLLIALLMGKELRDRAHAMALQSYIACAESPCFEGLLPLPTDVAHAESGKAGGLATASIWIEHDDAASNGRDEERGGNGEDDGKGDKEAQSDADRQRLRERIARGAMEASAGDLMALESLEESSEIAVHAEAAVAAAGSPEAALLAAVSRGDVSALEVRALLQRGANPDAAFLDHSALAVAARTCAAGVVKALVNAGATLDMKDAWGWTCLMHAIDAHTSACSREAVVMVLLDAGASVDVWGHDLKGPLDLMEAREAALE